MPTSNGASKMRWLKLCAEDSTALARSQSQLWLNHFRFPLIRSRLPWRDWKVKVLRRRVSLRLTLRGRPRPQGHRRVLARTPAHPSGARAVYSHAFTGIHSIGCAKKLNLYRLQTLYVFFLSGRKSRPITK